VWGNPGRDDPNRLDRGQSNRRRSGGIGQ
jgi:hypothetical protein